MAATKSEAADPIYKKIGELIRQYRTHPGGPNLSQDELGRAISLTRASIANIELGRQKVLAHTLIQIAAALHVAPEQLLPNGIATSHEAIFPRSLRAEARQWIESAIQNNCVNVLR